MDLDKKIALVTGSTKGIGAAIAAALENAGARVVRSGRSGGETCDVRDRRQVEDLMGRIERKYGGLDILVNNAGIGRFARLGELSVEDWHDVIETNLNGVFHCCHFALPLLRKQGGGWIFNISSLAGRNTFPTGAAYNASKFGLNGFSEAIMQELRHENIRVVNIAPGSVETDFSGLQRPPGDWKLRSEDVARLVMDTLRHESRSLPSYMEIRPSHPPRKS